MAPLLVAVLIIGFCCFAWWVLRPRPSLEPVDEWSRDALEQIGLLVVGGYLQPADYVMAARILRAGATPTARAALRLYVRDRLVEESRAWRYGPDGRLRPR